MGERINSTQYALLCAPERLCANCDNAKRLIVRHLQRNKKDSERKVDNVSLKLNNAAIERHKIFYDITFIGLEIRFFYDLRTRISLSFYPGEILSHFFDMFVDLFPFR